MHFSVRKLLASFLQQFMHWCRLCIKFRAVLEMKFGAYLASNLKMMREMNLLVVLFGTNLVNIISTKALKKHPIGCRLACF